MMETVVVILIVAVVAVLTARSIWRTATGKVGCSCTGQSCPFADCSRKTGGNPEAPS